MDSPESVELLKARQRPLTVEEYHRMIEADIFEQEDHLELVHGLLIARAPQRGPHARSIQRLNGLLVRGLGEAYDVRVQLPLTLGDDSEPEPDFSIVPHGEGGRGPDHPRSALLVIEVSRTSVRFDRMVKGPLYARSAIPEYWLIDVNGRQVEVMRDPEPQTGTYRTTFTVGPDDELTPSSLPGPRLRGLDLLA